MNSLSRDKLDYSESVQQKSAGNCLENFQEQGPTVMGLDILLRRGLGTPVT